MLEDDGHWLKLMRTAILPTDANICLCISGRDVVCTVTKDVNKEVELKVTCRIADPCHEQKPDQSPLSEIEHLEFPEASDHPEASLGKETVLNDCASPKAMLDYASNSICSYSDTAICSNSSLSTREVSVERSLKSDNVESDIDMEDFKEEVSSSTAQESPSSNQSAEARMTTSDGDVACINFKDSDYDFRKNKVNDPSALKTSSAYVFTNTDVYHAKHSRSRHSPNSSRNPTNYANPKSFCDACNIQFMAINTYQVHKKFYCKSRHESEDTVTSMPLLEASAGELSAAFKPAADTVIWRGGVNGNVVPSVIQPQAIFAAISTNPLILLPCSLIPGQGLVPQNGGTPTGTSGLVLQDRVDPQPALDIQTSTSCDASCPPRKTSHPVMNTGDKHNDGTLLSSTKIAALKRKISACEVLNLKKACIKSDSYLTVSEKYRDDLEDIDVDQDSPLDLSLKEKRVNDLSARKSPLRRRSSVVSSGNPPSPIYQACGSSSPPGHTVISSVPNASSPTNSYSNESTCYASQVSVVVQRPPAIVSERISPLPPVLQSAAVDKPISIPGMLPPKLLKQGNNVCEECHIVFIKYDNLVTHKKHYCAYRRRQLSAMVATNNQEHSSDDNNSNHSGIIEGTANFQTEDSKSGMRKLEYGIEHYRQVLPKPPQYLCDACGVRFSTSDTLTAHQTYYCMKKPDSAMAKASCKKGEDGGSSNVDSPFSGPEEWKCNYCDATCSSYDTIRRHLLTHNEPRGYRCLLCGYKGNTLRGMRTHACEHLTDDSTSIEEFMSSTIIGETGILPLECSDGDSDAQRDSANYKKRERTSSNNSEILKETSKHGNLVTDCSESEEISDSQKDGENVPKRVGRRRIGSVKAESGDSSSDVSGHRDSVNPMAFCDVVIKTENDHNISGDDSDRNESNQGKDHERDSKSPTVHSQSVIRVAERIESTSNSSKRKSKPKSSSELKSCKSCGVSFQHLSNLLTHKQYYCVSRSQQNCLPEAATVQ